jgi:hypothetical protein
MIKAVINREYLFRMSAVALFMLGVTIWSFYDGFVAWPEINREVSQVRAELRGTNLSARAWLTPVTDSGATPLDQIFHAQSLETPRKLIRRIDEAKMPENVPVEGLAAMQERESRFLHSVFEEPLYSAGDLQGQFVMAAITALVGIIIIATLIPKVRRVYSADESSVSHNGLKEQSFNYSDIVSMDWKLWPKKGIVKLFFKGGRTLVLDSWHFRGVKEIVEMIVRQRPDLIEQDQADKED